MAGMTPLPPTVLHSSTRLTHAQAHEALSSFLDLAENNAAYRPDSTLTERGPQSASTGANPNLTLHHLKRILQGIEGKRIGGEDVGRFFGDGARLAGVNGNRGLKRKYNDGVDVTLNKPARREVLEERNSEDGEGTTGIAVTGAGDGWQDKEDYELAQREGLVDVLDDDRQPGMSLEQPANAEEAEDLTAIKVNGKKTHSGDRHQSLDKEARKKAKKDRMKDDKKKRQEDRAKN